MSSAFAWESRLAAGRPSWPSDDALPLLVLEARSRRRSDAAAGTARPLSLRHSPSRPRRAGPFRVPSGPLGSARRRLRSPGERGALPHRSRRPRHRGLRGPSAGGVAVEGRGAGDGHESPRPRFAGGRRGRHGVAAGCPPGLESDTSISMSARCRRERPSMAARSDSRPTARSYPGALFLSAGGYHHHLGINTWAGPTAVAGRPR